MSDTIHETLRARADADGVLSFRDFSEAALYDSVFGYYRRDRSRVGRSRETDFYTAASLGVVFADLLREAILTQLQDDPRSYTLVELGTEPGGGAMAKHGETFAAYRAVGVTDTLELPSKAVVFANELLDAQPFHRFVYQGGAWQESGVKVTDERLAEVLLDEPSVSARGFLEKLPAAGEGYRLDISLAAEEQLGRIARQVERGLIVMFDYGKSWQELIEACPAGTARGYYRHELTGNLLERPGGQDLTCHVCWDRLEQQLASCGFEDIRLERQEAYFMKHAVAAIERIVMAPDAGMSREKQTLKELLYPGHMGHKFQVLTARR